jgi:hypothetical protein
MRPSPSLRLILLLMTMTVTVEAGFETTSYCERLCLRGLGGNLCQCNAVHFAGKRVHTADENSAHDGGDLLQLMLHRRPRDRFGKYPIGYFPARPNHKKPLDVPVRQPIDVDNGRCTQEYAGGRGSSQSATTFKSADTWQRNPGSIADAKTVKVDGGNDNNGDHASVESPTLALASDGSWVWDSADDMTKRRRR